MLRDEQRNRTNLQLWREILIRVEFSLLISCVYRDGFRQKRSAVDLCMFVLYKWKNIIKGDNFVRRESPTRYEFNIIAQKTNDGFKRKT